MPDVPPRRFSDLTRAEAQAFFDEFVTGREARADAFVEEVRRLGGPAQRLDRSIESLEPLWRWMVRRLHRPWWARLLAGRPSRPITDARMRAAGPPWWYEFHPTFGQQMGLEAARLATGLIEYYFAVAERNSPGSGWTMGRRKSEPGYQAPMFQVPGRGERSYSLLLVATLRAIERQYGGAQDNYLRTLMEQWLGLDPAYEAEMRRLSEPLPPWRVGRIDHPVFTHEISIRDDLAWRSERRVARLVVALESEQGVERAAHEDRETILVRAPGLDEAAIDAAVTRLWSTRRKPIA